MDFENAVEAFDAGWLPIAIEPAAAAAVHGAVDVGALVLLGEIHGVEQNPLIVASLMRTFDLRVLGLEWPVGLQDALDTFLDGGVLDIGPFAESNDGRITAGHFAVLRALRREGLLERVILFNPFGSASWSDRDRQMAEVLLASLGPDPALILAGNMHTQLRPHRHGVPMGVHLAATRPGTVEIRIRYLSGEFFNLSRKRIQSSAPPPEQGAGYELRASGGQLEVTVPVARPAVVPGSPMHEELRMLYTEDQQDRSGGGLPGNILERDRARRGRVRELLDAGAARTGADFFHAAMVFQHGDALEDYLRAHQLALRASELGHRPGRWLAAAAYDRWLVRQGRPQKYGTQYQAQGDAWELCEVDPETTDAERAEWDVPPLAEARRRAADRAARRAPERPAAVGRPLADMEVLATHRVGDFEVRVILMPPDLPTRRPRLEPLQAGDPVPWLPAGLTAGRLERGFGAAADDDGAWVTISWHPAETTIIVGWREDGGPPPEPELVAAADGCAISWEGEGGIRLVAISRPDGRRWTVIGNRPREELLRVAESLAGR